MLSQVSIFRLGAIKCLSVVDLISLNDFIVVALVIGRPEFKVVHPSKLIVVVMLGYQRHCQMVVMLLGVMVRGTQAFGGLNG